MKIKLLLLVIALALLASCGLRRKNPLDPYENPQIIVPNTVIDIVYTITGLGTSNKSVTFTWNANSSANTDGYYLYRGLSYNSSFAKVDTVTTNTCTHGAKPWHIVMPGDYYYKVSAWKTYQDRRLEGPLSTHIFVRIPN